MTLSTHLPTENYKLQLEDRFRQDKVAQLQESLVISSQFSQLLP